MSVTPVLYLSHGAPPLADDATWTRQLAEWSAELPRPKAILVVSAHWEKAPLTLGATTTVPLVYDFWGFPEHYYRVTYPAPGAPGLAAKVRKLLHGPGTPVHDAPDRGLDHGAYVPLVEMYPDADIPVLQLSMPSLDPRELFELGRRLKPLRDEGVLIVGSGFFTHNLSAMRQVGVPTAGHRSGPPSSTTGVTRCCAPETWTRCWTSNTRHPRPLSRTHASSTSRRCSSPSAPAPKTPSPRR
jgi:4,5-DOPA dioxygenase extradiol